MQDEISAGAGKSLQNQREGILAYVKLTAKSNQNLLKLSSMPVKNFMGSSNRDQQVWFINNFGANVSLETCI